MNANDQTNERTPPVVLAALGALLCLPIIRLVTSPMGRFVNIHVAEWLMFGSFVIIPTAVAFVILYRSSWHREYSVLRRIVSVLLSSCAVYCVDLLIAGALLLIACLMIGLTRSVGGN
jgi:hypothetical protein